MNVIMGELLIVVRCILCGMGLLGIVGIIFVIGMFVILVFGML